MLYAHGKSKIKRRGAYNVGRVRSEAAVASPSPEMYTGPGRGAPGEVERRQERDEAVRTAGPRRATVSTTTRGARPRRDPSASRGPSEGLSHADVSSGGEVARGSDSALSSRIGGEGAAAYAGTAP